MQAKLAKLEYMTDKISILEHGRQRRTERLLGHEAQEQIFQQRVLIFGIGGVGSWCAEALVRTGIRHLTIVDSDRVCMTNCNRQLMATSTTVGKVKVEVLRQRLLDINPDADIVALQQVYNASTADAFHMEDYDYIIDAIDSLTEKAHLILHATALPRHTTFVSSMGAALRIDPFAVRKAEFWKVKGDPLARALRNKFKRQNTFPARKFYCVYSEEQPMKNSGEDLPCGTTCCICHNTHTESTPETENSNETSANENHSRPSHSSSDDMNNTDWSERKAQINGSLCHITAIFGMAIAGIIIEHIINKNKS